MTPANNMGIEFLCFIGGTLILLVPGVWLAGALSLGDSLLERWTNGCSLGLAMAVYLAAAISHFDLRGFYPVWIIVALICLVLRIKTLAHKRPNSDGSVQILMVLILLVVGFSRFAMALPLELPPGSLDPTFHLVLARQIQITHHAIDRWPFANIPLNYPTGSHVLVVVLSALTHLPLHTAFKDLIPLMGVLSTAQMYVFARRLTTNSLIALYSAAIYGLWAWFGSLDYFRWGGVPNELSMLLLIAMLSIDAPTRGGTVAMAILFSGVVLVHHHVMVVATLILALIVLWQMAHHRPWRSLAIATVAGFVLDAFFLAPYALHIANFRSTGMVIAGEPMLPLLNLPGSFGYALVCLSAIGIVLCLARKIRCHPVVGIGSLTLVVLFVMGEDVVPLTLSALHRTAFTFFTPSRFLTDLNYFLPIFAGSAVYFFQHRLRVPLWVVLIFILLAPLGDIQRWTDIFNLPALPPPVVDACHWIRENTPTDTLVDNVDAWTTYLCWREPALMAIPVSEPLAEYHPAGERIPKILSGQIRPDSPGLMIVRIGDVRHAGSLSILWKDSAGAAVLKEWP